MKDPLCTNDGCYPVGRCQRCIEYLMHYTKEELITELFILLTPLGVTRIDCDGETYTTNEHIDNKDLVN